MESPMAEHGKKKVNIFSCWTCQEEYRRYYLLSKHYDNHMMSDTNEI